MERSSLTSADKALIGRARYLAGLSGNEIREHTGERDAAMAQASLLGECQHVLRALADVAERAGGDGAEDEDAPELDESGIEEYRCATCGAQVGHFVGYDGWWHFTGSGTADAPNALYTADHPATPGGMLP